jgi:hypothetical protein
MSDWLTWPADLLLGIAGIVTSWFVRTEESSFSGIRTMVAMLLLAALVASIVYGQSLARSARLALRHTASHGDAAAGRR